MAQIIDGLCDFDNVTADMIARHNMSMYGTGDYVLQIDECLEYDLISNNEIHVKDGMYIMQGRRGCVKKGTTDICIIENGAQAVNRNDIIVIEYVKDEATRLESHTTKVIKGVPAEVAVDPELITGDINAGAVLHQMPLYRVKIEGLNVVAVEQLFEIGSVAAETVDPMLATESGYAADALAVKNQFSEQNKNLSETNKNIENLSSNFTTATKAIGDALVAKGCSVPTGTSLSEMANILKNNVRALIDLGITTSNTSSIGTASASSYYTAGNNQAFKAFDTDGYTSWHSLEGMPQWIQFQFKTARVVKRIFLQNRCDDATNIQYVKTFDLLASNNGSSWTTLGSYTHSKTNAGSGAFYNVSNNTAYKYYRINVKSAQTTYCAIGALQFYC